MPDPDVKQSGQSPPQFSTRSVLLWAVSVTTVAFLIAVGMVTVSIRRGEVVEGERVRGSVIRVFVHGAGRYGVTSWRLNVRLTDGRIVTAKPQTGVRPLVGQLVSLRELSYEGDATPFYRVEETWPSAQAAPPPGDPVQTLGPRSIP